MGWLAPWNPITDRALAGRLERELARGHVSYGVRVRAIGCRDDQDDVLFAFDDSQRVAVVHLTYVSGARPDRPPWPRTALFDDLSAFACGRMAADHDGCQE